MRLVGRGGFNEKGGRWYPLIRAAVEKTYAAAGHGKVEVVLAKIASGVGCLDDVLFAFGWAGGESQSLSR